MAIRLVSFDLDGTLFPDTTTCIELGRCLGHLDVIRDLEARYARYEIDNAQVAEGDAIAYAGRTTEFIEEAVLAIPTISGIQETIAALRAHGIATLIVTVTWSFAARALAKRYAVDGYAGAEMEEIDGILAGRVCKHFEAADKVRFVEGFAQARGIALSECAAVGDSRSDIPLFQSVGLSIALNATPEARAGATRSIETRDLRDILAMLF